MGFDEFRRKALSPLVLISVLLFALLGAAISYGFLVSFKSRSVVSFDASISEFRILQEQVNSMFVFDRYVRGDKAVAGSDFGVRNQIVNSDNWISPIFRFNKKDAKELIGLKDPGRLSDLVGYEITSFSSDPEAARLKVDFLVNYVFDASLKIQIENYISDTLAAKRLVLTSALLEQDSETYNLLLLKDRLTDLKRLSVNYPATGEALDWNARSAEKDGDHYMPLAVQMIAAERERFDINKRLAKTQRQVEGLPFEEAMLTEHEKIAQTINGGKALALALIKDTRARMATTKQGYEINALLRYEDKYSKMIASAFTPSRFIVSPTLPVMAVRSPLKITVGFALLGGLLALLWQFRTSIRTLVNEIGGRTDSVDADALLPEIKRLHRA